MGEIIYLWLVDRLSPLLVFALLVWFFFFPKQNPVQSWINSLCSHNSHIKLVLTCFGS